MLSLWCLLSSAFAATIGQIPVQGELTGADGLPLQGTHALTFRVWTGAPSASASTSFESCWLTLVSSRRLPFSWAAALACMRFHSAT